MYIIILLLSCIITLLSILLLKIKKIETQVLLFGLVFLTSFSFYFMLLVVDPKTKKIPVSHKIPIISIDPKTIILPPQKKVKQIKTLPPKTMNIISNNCNSNSSNNIHSIPKMPKGNFCKNCFRELNSLNSSPYNQTQKNICKYCSPNFSLIY